MKHLLSRFLLVFAPPLLFVTCTKVAKNVADYYPQVGTVSAVTNADGSVTITGQVTTTVTTGISFCGFCMDTIPQPDMATNQIFATLTGRQFTATYSSALFSSTKRYYFRAWATNDNGYAIGMPVSDSAIGFDTSQIPCHPAANNMGLTGKYGSENDAYSLITGTNNVGTNYEINAYTGTHTLTIDFQYTPTQGIYTTSAADNPGGTAVLLSFDGIRAKSGSKLYLQQISKTQFDVTICQDSVFMTQYNIWYSMTTKFRCAY